MGTTGHCAGSKEQSSRVGFVYRGSCAGLELSDPERPVQHRLSGMDCYPTILEAAAIEKGPETILDGESILPLLKQTGGLEREAIFFHYPNYAFHKRNRLASAVRCGDHKLIRRYGDGSIELYNLDEDIGEKSNLAARFPELASQLEQELEKWLNEVDACLPTRVEP